MGGLQGTVGGGPGEVIVAELDHQLGCQRVDLGEQPAGCADVLADACLGVGGHRRGQQLRQPSGDLGVAAVLKDRAGGDDFPLQVRQRHGDAGGGRRVEQRAFQCAYRVRGQRGWTRMRAAHRGASQAGQSSE